MALNWIQSVCVTSAMTMALLGVAHAQNTDKMTASEHTGHAHHSDMEKTTMQKKTDMNKHTKKNNKKHQANHGSDKQVKPCDAKPTVQDTCSMPK
ncbi:hypothetical protein [Hydromonas duriensis]|uniref:Pentapeptide MXKDX repeat protein n=1 Tax=Hydromonas duriensis TaxID=1527608 RepID=A0A4R6Y877_9BURK|nr:hypothetical protein [Hydromonas duriensis]TDR31552.1 hypothetical protein DFR44_10969 [Hydromonas duriensis]